MGSFFTDPINNVYNNIAKFIDSPSGYFANGGWQTLDPPVSMRKALEQDWNRELVGMEPVAVTQYDVGKALGFGWGLIVGGGIAALERNGAVGAGETNSGAGNGLNNDVANTFRSGSYTQTTLSEDTTFYRVYGGEAGKVGSYMTRTPQNGGLQSQMDLALNPQWGNTATSVTTVTVPKGTVIYEGFAAPQGNLLGGGSQVYIPEVNASWFK